MRSGWSAILLALCAGCAEAEVECEPHWSILSKRLGSAVLGIGGTASNDVYIVGGGTGYPSRGGLVAHYDGRTWSELNLGRKEALWAVKAFARNDAWMSGDNGLIIHWDGVAFRVVHEGGPTLFGVFGTSSHDLWFVGGKPGAGAVDDNAYLVHFDGMTFERDLTMPRRDIALLHIWGGAGGDLWITGEGGTLLHRTPEGWYDHSNEVMGAPTPFSLNGCGTEEAYAVGGQYVYAMSGDHWNVVEQARISTRGVNVSCSKKGVLVVGDLGLRLIYDKETQRWSNEQSEVQINADLHGSWSAPEGAYWAAGGYLQAPMAEGPRKAGVVAYYGCRAPPPLTELEDPTLPP